MAEIRHRVRDLTTPRRDPMQDRMYETLQILEGKYNAKMPKGMKLEQTIATAYFNEHTEPCFLCGGEPYHLYQFIHPEALPGAFTIYGLCYPCEQKPDGIKQAERELLEDLTEPVL